MEPSPIREERPALAPSILHAIDDLDRVALEELDAFALLNRVDTKFLLTLDQTARVFVDLAGRYRVIEVNGLRSSYYRTLYFDTPNLAKYRAHHDGKRDRYKVRTRAYLDTDTVFFEVKRKTNRDRTIKVRIAAPDLSPRLNEGMAAFLSAHAPFAPSDIEPGITNDFVRVSLIGVDDIERLTLDFALTMALGSASITLPSLVIAEVKQPKFSTRSPFVQRVRELRVEPVAFSKYCYAVAVLRVDARRNLFKERMLYIDRLLARGGSS